MGNKTFSINEFEPNLREGMIPSKTMRKFLEFGNYPLDGATIASMIYYGAMSIDTQIDTLRTYAPQFDDPSLKDEIIQYTDALDADLNHFVDNEGESCIYTIVPYDGDEYSHMGRVAVFKDYESAINAGKTLYPRFWVSKYLAWDEETADTIVSNPRYAHRYARNPVSNLVARAVYQADKGLIALSSPAVFELMEWNDFHKRFYGFPIPFKRGAVVYNTFTNVVAVVESPLNEWMDKWKSGDGNLTADDAKIAVSSYDIKTSHFLTLNVNPLLLELVDPSLQGFVPANRTGIEFYQNCGKLLQAMPKGVSMELLSSIFELRDF